MIRICSSPLPNVKYVIDVVQTTNIKNAENSMLPQDYGP